MKPNFDQVHLILTKTQIIIKKNHVLIPKNSNSLFTYAFD